MPRFQDVTIAGIWSMGAQSQFEGNLTPDTDDLRTLGDATHRWKQLFLSGALNADPLQIGTNSFVQEVSGDLWITANAFWDGSNWQRVDVTKRAFGLNLRGNNNFPGESEQGAALWVAQPAANPINPTFGVTGGWEVGIDVTAFRDLVLGGFAIEMDGHGSSPFGRFINSPFSGNTHKGTLVNLFGDFSGRDNDAAVSWFAGIIGDAFRVRRLAASAAISDANFTDMLQADEPSDGDTALLVRRNESGTLTLQRVSMGAADSGGAGYKVLRVPN